MFTFFSSTSGNKSENEKAQQLNEFEDKKIPRDVSFYTHQGQCSILGTKLGKGAEAEDVRSFVNTLTQEETAIKRVFYTGDDEEEEEENKDHEKILQNGIKEAKIHKILYGLGEIHQTENGFYILMKKLPPTTLADLYLIGNPQISYNDFLNIFISIIDAVNGMHAKNITHGELHSRNILLDAKNQKAYLCDFTTSQFIIEEKNRDFLIKEDIYELGGILIKFKNKFPFLNSEAQLIALEKSMRDKNPNIRISLDAAKKCCLKELERISSSESSKMKTFTCNSSSSTSTVSI
jgi:serine/threonine protein kinase